MKELMMRVFVAGATGAIGKQLVPRLVEAGHEVHGMTRSEAKQGMLHELGAVPVGADAPAREMPETLAAIRHLEEAVLGAEWTEGIVLRYGVFYGSGTSMATGEEQFEMIRKRKFPLVGDGGGVWSFIHVADAAEATRAAVEHGSRGVYNVVDD